MRGKLGRKIQNKYYWNVVNKKVVTNCDEVKSYARTHTHRGSAAGLNLLPLSHCLELGFSAEIISKKKGKLISNGNI